MIFAVTGQCVSVNHLCCPPILSVRGNVCVLKITIKILMVPIEF
jgi:hypothetical protein